MYTIHDYLLAIERELKRRSAAYPKLLKKAEDEKTYEEYLSLKDALAMQKIALVEAADILKNGREWTAMAEDIHLELHREMACRKKFYSLFVWKKQMKKEEAEAQKAVWKSLCQHWDAHYMNQPNQAQPETT